MARECVRTACLLTYEKETRGEREKTTKSRPFPFGRRQNNERGDYHILTPGADSVAMNTCRIEKNKQGKKNEEKEAVSSVYLNKKKEKEKETDCRFYSSRQQIGRPTFSDCV